MNRSFAQMIAESNHEMFLKHFVPNQENIYKEFEGIDVSPAVQAALRKADYKGIIQDKNLFWQVFCLSYCSYIKSSLALQNSSSFLLTLSEDGKKLMCIGYKQLISDVKCTVELFRLFSMNLVSGRDDVVKVLYKDFARDIHLRVEGGEDCGFANWLQDRSNRIPYIWFNDYILPTLPFLFDSIGLTCTQGRKDSEVLTGRRVEIESLDVLIIGFPDSYPILPLKFPDREKSKLLDFFQSQHKTKKGEDIELITKDGGVLKCHAAVISAYGGVFREILDADMRESRSKRINLDHLSEKTVSACLDFLYFGKQGLSHDFVVENQVDLPELFAMAHTYQIEDLMTYCANLITRCYGQESKENIKKMADLYSNKHLQDFYTHLCALSINSTDSHILVV